MEKPGVLLIGCFLLQGALSLVFYGIPSILFSALVPPGVGENLPWALRVLVLGYFGLGIASIYGISLGGDLSAGKVLGMAYFAVGAVASIAVLLESRDSYENPLLLVVFSAWLAVSLTGFLIVGTLKNPLPFKTASMVSMLLLGASAAVSVLNAEWVVLDLVELLGSLEALPIQGAG